MTEFNPNCGKCGMLNSRGFCSLTACRYPSNVIAVQPVNVPFVPKPTTNADRIRSMTDEELVDMFWEFLTDSQFKNPYREKAELLDWLKSPADKEGG